MSDGFDLDLSGEWTGVYNYPVALPPVAFEARIIDSNGRISGTTSEVGGTPFTGQRRLDAVIDGRREGQMVQFIKMYEQADGEYDVVHYSGSTNAEGDELSGNWHVAGTSGTFLMIRRPGASAMVERLVGETADR